ncbi:MAG: protein translocase subunit SecD, partial [Anaerolineae bacterium]
EFLGITRIDKDIKVHQGLDLQGGLQVLLEADVPEGEEIDRESMDAAKVIVENRVNGLGVTEPLVQTQGERRIIVELPGIENQDEAIATFRETGLLEFIDAGTTYLEEGTVVRTTTPLREGEESLSPAAIITPTVTVEVTPTRPMTLTEEITPTATVEVTPTRVITLTDAPTSEVTGAVPITATAEMSSPASSPMPTSEITGTAPITAAEETAPKPSPTPVERVFTTVMTGKDLETASVGLDQYGKPEILFRLRPEGAKIFADFTAKNVGKYLAIALDKVIISCPVIQTAIPDGSGRITGRFDLETARRIAIQLRYGALPIPLRVETIRSVGPTLGQDSMQKSIRAGAIGGTVVLSSMLIYYRLPGFLADLALIIYGLLNFAIYKFGIPLPWPPFFQPVTLTLPGITGFILSTGMAVDANILIFERLKEEIRAGRSLKAAIDAGFDRAWTSIRDSNLSTILSCIILFWFGSNFGASIVKGFAITLGIGVVISMFTAITVTRTFIRLVFNLASEELKDKHWLLGI